MPARRRHAAPQQIKFTVSDMDGLGQGVDLQSEPTFIAKTLPGDRGKATLYRKAKGVRFARLESTDDLTASSPLRTEPACLHFQQCPGCDYLHTDYDTELGFKRAALSRLLRGLGRATPEPIVTPAQQRLHYRNRLQLHYRHSYLGMLDGKSNRVIEIPHCQLPEAGLQSAFEQLYAEKPWLQHDSKEGHCEIYRPHSDAEVAISWNDSYAAGGFTQVNSGMNPILQQRPLEILGESIRNGEISSVLDLFSGDGNLSAALALATRKTPDDEATKPFRVGVDLLIPENETVGSHFLALDLADEKAYERFKRRSPVQRFDAVLVDPPRSGFKALSEWLKAVKPKELIYISCNAATACRDIRALDDKWQIQQVELLDMFPGTRHFETLFWLSSKGKKKREP